MQHLNALLVYLTGPVLIVALLGTGLFLTFRMKFVQFRGLIEGIRITSGKYNDPRHPGDVTHFKALCGALSATVGVGNIAGVAAAIAIGGPGAVFWMWMTAILGMAVKFTECTLAQQFRIVHEDGTVSGGPMYYIERGLGRKFKPLAILFAFFTVFASFGIGNMVQSNQVAQILDSTFGIPPVITGVVISIMTGLVIVGGMRRIGQVAGILVPFMSIAYVGGALVILAMNAGAIIPSLALIFKSAFTGTAAAGGFAGSAIMLALRSGVSRGLFSNEAGLGSAPIIHAAAKTRIPVREGLVALLEPFIDTLVICTMTALVIVTSDLCGSGLRDAPLTSAAFENGFAGGRYIVTFTIPLFAYSTAISWSYYGDRAFEYLLGRRAIMPFRIIYCIVLFFGAIASSTTAWVGTVWAYADIANLLMAFPNLLALWLLSGVVAKSLKAYMKDYGASVLESDAPMEMAPMENEA
ncbi:MAG: Amino-acid carrier protein AlsT [bacterium ADurb.Bin270]|jgi:AGCS family alanine or glycine:cation symporter|nr:sodium:alanine symporter family protein [Myxococcales bacterium]OQA60725.1 MAG: Amino-acid carrier protein AlsT [bacterium ADurb.Bin270]